MTKMLPKRVDVPNIDSQAHYNCTNSFFLIYLHVVFPYMFTHISIKKMSHFLSKT